MEEIYIKILEAQLDLLVWSGTEEARPYMFALGVPVVLFYGFNLYKRKKTFLAIYQFLKKFGGN